MSLNRPKCKMQIASWTIISATLCALAFSDGGCQSNWSRYSNTRVYRVSVQTKPQLLEILSFIEDMQLDLLNAFDENKDLEVAVGPNEQMKFEDGLKERGIRFQIGIKDLMQALELRKPLKQMPQMEWTQYHPVEHIFEWLRYQAKKHSFIATLQTLGHSYEGRPLLGVKISVKPGNKAIFIECNIHAMEWISSATCTCYLNKLLNSRDPKIWNLMLNHDWIIVPVMNPDGLAYTHDVAPLWRKNRRPNGAFIGFIPCVGVDMNRNFDYHWKAAGFGVKTPCGQFYAGSEPESEPEVRALRDYISAQKGGYIRMYLAVHSFGNKLLVPYGHTEEPAPNHQQLLTISKGFSDAAGIKYGTNFTYGTSGKILYPVSGSGKDWAYGVKNIRYSATIELRDEGKYGFFLPPSQILEVCEEFTDGFVGLVEAAKKEKLFN